MKGKFISPLLLRTSRFVDNLIYLILYIQYRVYMCNWSAYGK